VLMRRPHGRTRSELARDHPDAAAT
jgi:hypothetical protein